MDPSRFIACIQPCFLNGFVNLFRRLSCGEDTSSHSLLSEDWLVDYNELLDAGLENRCPREKVDTILALPKTTDSDLVLRRIAVSALRHSDDKIWRDNHYRRELGVFLDSAEKGDIAKEILKEITLLRLMEFVNDNTIRRLFLNSIYSPVKDEIHFSILECYGALLEPQVLTLDDVLSDKPIEEITDDSRQSIRIGIEDALFSNNGDVRLEAARLLMENFEDWPNINFDGSDKDWNNLPSFISPQRILVLKWILKNNRHELPNGGWRDHIKNLISEYESRVERV